MIGNIRLWVLCCCSEFDLVYLNAGFRMSSSTVFCFIPGTGVELGTRYSFAGFGFGKRPSGCLYVKKFRVHGTYSPTGVQALGPKLQKI